MKKYIFSLLLAGCVPSIVVLAQTKEQAIELLMKKKDVEAAKDAIDKVTAGGKSDAKAWFYKGMIYKAVYDDETLRLNNKDADLDSYKAYKKSIEMGSKEDDHITQSREDMFELAVIFASTAAAAYDDGMKGEQNALKRAIEYYDAFIDIYNTVQVEQANIDKTLKENDLDFLKVKYMAGTAKEKAGDRVGAEKYYQELVDAKFYEPLLYISLKTLYVGDGQRDKATKVLIDGRNRLPESIEIALEYAKLITEEKRYNEALDIAEKAAKKDRNSALPHVTIGEIYEKMMNTAKAEEAYNHAIAMSPDDFEPAHHFGNYHYRRAEAIAKKDGAAIAKDAYLMAITYYESANRADPKNQENLKKLYDCYIKVDNQRKADQIKSRIK
jgi:Flp pilus assembly protein TadD